LAHFNFYGNAKPCYLSLNADGKGNALSVAADDLVRFQRNFTGAMLSTPSMATFNTASDSDDVVSGKSF